MLSARHTTRGVAQSTRLRRGFFVTIYIMAFLWAAGIAFPEYVWSSFIENFVPEHTVGLYFAVANFVALVGVLTFAHVLRRFGNYRVIMAVTVLSVVMPLLLVYAHGPWSVLLYFALYWLFVELLLISLDVLLENISDDGHTGRIRSFYLTAQNLGWLVAMVGMGVLADRADNFNSILIIGSALLVGIIVILLVHRKKFRDYRDYKSRTPLQLISVLHKRKNLRNGLWLSFALQFFYAIMVLYMPIYLHQYIGLSFQTIGIIFATMLFAFIVIEAPAGVIADRFLGEKEMMIAGVLLMSASTLAIFVLDTRSVVVWIAVLFATRVGAALLEAMQEIYFFKQISRKDSDLINVFRDFRSLAWLIASAAGSLVLIFLPIGYIFVFLGFLLLLAIIPASRLHDTR